MTEIGDTLAGWSQKFRPHADGAQPPSQHEPCLGCGPGNPHGHRLSVYRRGARVTARHNFDERHAGALGIAYGGAVAPLIADLDGILRYLTRGPAVTGHLQVDYVARVTLGVGYELSAESVTQIGRKLAVRAPMTHAHRHQVMASSTPLMTVERAHFEQGHTARRDRA